MSRFNASSFVVLLAIATSLTVTASASAATKGKKLTLDEAWALCKAEVDRTYIPEQHRDKYLAGGACMRRHGYRL
jgi:hypothetical protein